MLCDSCGERDAVVQLTRIEAVAKGGHAGVRLDRLRIADVLHQPIGGMVSTGSAEVRSPRPASAAELARSVVPPALAVGWLGPALGLAPWRSRRPRRVGWAVACALLGRTDAFARLGPFDERIFLYGEDMELGLRARRDGVETWFWPSARVIHHGGRSIEAVHGGEAFELRAQGRHHALVLARGRRAADLDDLLQATTFLSRALIKSLLGRPARRERAQLRALASIRRGLMPSGQLVSSSA